MRFFLCGSITEQAAVTGHEAWSLSRRLQTLRQTRSAQNHAAASGRARLPPQSPAGRRSPVMLLLRNNPGNVVSSPKGRGRTVGTLSTRFLRDACMAFQRQCARCRMRGISASAAATANPRKPTWLTASSVLGQKVPACTARLKRIFSSRLARS